MEIHIEGAQDGFIGEINDEKMNEDRVEEEATQPATQLMIDPRRLGHHNSGLDDNELSDVICILHPASMSACRAMDVIMEDAPQHTISIGGVELKIRDDPLRHHSGDEPGTFELAAQGALSRDIALRLSAQVKDPLGGFRFGRNSQRCDFVLGKGNTDGAKRISNVHFRIYINEHGIIMLEDQSTNGTMVDNIMLRAKEKDKNHQYRHMLEQGSMITILMTAPDEDMKFVVRIPPRDGFFADEYLENLNEYFLRCDAIKEAREAQRALLAAQTPGGENPVTRGPPDIFGPTDPRTQSTSMLDSRRHIKEWKGGANYNKIHQIGKGAFASVYLITAKFNGDTFAAKELEKRRFMKNGILDQKVEMEMTIMRKIKHPNIVQYIEHIDWDEYLYLIMEYVPGGDLGNLVSMRGQLAEPMVQTIAGQMLSALDYLHQKNITHRDVKPDNILIQNLDPVQVKLTDFGLSKMVDNDDTFMHTFCGTLLYCAPEVYSEYREYDKKSGLRTRRGKGKENLPPQRYDHLVDVYSLGGVLFYSLCGTPPWPAKSGTTYQELLNDVMTKALDIRPLQHAEASENAIQCVKSMLATRPENRPSIDILQTAPWFTGAASMMGFDEEEEDDEVDIVDEEFGDENLEHDASQLSLHDKNKNDSQVDYYNGDDIDLDVDEVELIQATRSELGVPDSQSATSESFAFMRNPPGNNNGRLFGEVNASALGSSGVIPRGHLNLPISQSFQSFGNNTAYTTSTSSNHNLSIMDEHQNGAPRAENRQTTGNGHLETTPSTEEIPASFDAELHASNGPVTAPSLMGAESMVGNLQMNSPSPVAMSPQVPTLQAPVIIQFNESIRRAREDEDQEEPRPNPKRMKSERQIDVTLSKTIFYSKDKSTWHDNYPALTLSEYNELEAKAKSRGETFTHGQPTFDELMAEYAKTSSSSTSAKPRADSEPTVEQGRRVMLQRDDRTMEDTLRQDTTLPATSHDDLASMTGLDVQMTDTDPGTVVLNNTLAKGGVLPQSDAALPVIEATAEPTKAILAQLTTVDGSALQCSLEATQTLTTWGRGADNTHHYPNRGDNRIPVYAIKLILANPLAGLVSESQSSLAFYISTKATWGIGINGVNLPSCKPKDFRTPAKFWGELKTGDTVSVWSILNTDQFIRFRFEAFVGSSQQTRAENNPFKVITDKDVIKELDNFQLSPTLE